MNKFRNAVSVCLSVIFLSVGAAWGKQAPSSARPFFRAVDQKLDKKQALSSAERTRLAALARDPDYFTRAHAITTLSWSRDMAGKKAASRVARPALKDSEWLVRHAALNALRRIHASDLRAVAGKLAYDPDLRVRESAEAILQKK